MAAILTLRRGTTTPSLAQSELFFNQTTNTLNVGGTSGVITLVKIGSNTGNITLSGDLGINGNITGSNLYITNNVTIDGNIHIGGNITLGSGSDGDIVNVNAPLSGSIIPDTTEVYDLGASDKKYRNIFAVSASFDSILLPGSGILSSSTDNFTDFSQSVDSRLDNLQLDSQSQDSRLDNIELFTSSQESNNNDIIELFATASNHETRIDDLSSLTGSYATTGSNIFIGNQTITGSVGINGDTTIVGGMNANLFMNPQTLTADIIVPDNTNALVLGPVAIGGSISLGLSSSLLVLPQDFTSFASTGSNQFRGNQYITGSIIPEGSGSHDLGSITNPFRDLYLSSASLRIVNDGEILSEISANSERLLVSASEAYFTGNVNVSGSVTAQFFSGSFIGTLPSQDGRLSNLESFTSSQETKNTTLGTYTGSVDGRLSQLETNTGSQESDLIELFSTASDHESRIDELELFNSELNNYTSSADSRLLQLEINTGSQDGRITNLELTSQSHDDRLSSLETQTGSISTEQSVQDSRLDNIEDYTSSLKQSIDISSGNLVVLGNLTVQGTQTSLNSTETFIEDKTLTIASGSTTSAEADGAGLIIDGADVFITWNHSQTALVVNQKVSSSVGFKGDGSELTGVTANSIDFDNITDKPTLVSGSDQLSSSFDFRYLEINGDSVVSGSSQIVITDTNGFSTFSGSFSGSLATQDGRLDNLEITSQSHDNRISELEIKSGSQDGRLSNLELFTSSQESKNTTLGTYTSSINSQITNLELFTSSQESKNTTLGTYTGSVDGRLSQLELNSGSHSGRLINLEEFTSSQESKNTTLGSYTSSVDSSLSQLGQVTQSLNSFTSSIDSIIKNKINLEGVVSSSADTSTISLSIQNGVISGSVIGGVVSGSDQLTSSLDGLYEVSGSVAELVGIHQVSGSLGSAAWYNVTNSLDISLSTASLNDEILLTAGAVKRFVVHVLDNVIQTADITSVNAGDGISGGATSGDATVTLDTASLHFTDGVLGTIEPFSSSVSSSIAALESSSGYINYVTNSIEQLTGIEVADFDSNVAVTFIDGTLKFIFGTPAVPSSVVASLSGFLNDRFNQVQDEYNINGNWNNGGYTLISASLFEDSTLLNQVGTGTSVSFTTTTSGSHTYRLEYTASSPLDGAIYTTSTTVSGTLSKTNPASPTLTPTATVQLGASGNQIEQGATGSISFTSSSADPSNGWDLVSLTTNVESPYLIEGILTGSTSVTIAATASYESPIGDNDPDLTAESTTSRTYTKIRSLRYGASTATSFTEGDLVNLALWDTTLGGNVGTIAKGTTNPSGQSVTITWSGDKFHYIVFDSSRSNLSNITTAGFGVFGSFTLSTVGQYKIYKINTLQAGGAGSTITYTLT
jgi:uncharacterized protein with FMN-binding domain/uncharacterized coiled-coil protein SlyX